jgi:hypothetical protein
MNLYCLQSFRQGTFDVKAGETITVETPVGEWLLSSFPAYWQIAESAPTDETPLTEAPPADKAIKRAAKTK